MVHGTILPKITPYYFLSEICRSSYVEVDNIVDAHTIQPDNKHSSVRDHLLEGLT